MQSKQTLAKKLAPLTRYDLKRKSEIVLLLEKTQKEKHILNLEELEKLTPFTTNSSIGLSKLLHFLAPSSYPIWDTWVANVFYETRPAYEFVRSAHAFLNYAETLRMWERAHKQDQIFVEIRNLNHFQLKNVSILRLLELVLWHKGKSLGR